MSEQDRAVYQTPEETNKEGHTREQVTNNTMASVCIEESSY